MNSDTIKKIDALMQRHEKLKAETTKHNERLDDLQKKKCYKWRFIEIVNIDGGLTSTAHDVLDLRMDVEILQSKFQADPENILSKNIDTLLRNIVRLQDFLLSLQRINTHLYVRFSCYSAISIALLYLFLSFLSLISGYVFSSPTRLVPTISSSPPSSASSALAPNSSTRRQ